MMLNLDLYALSHVAPIVRGDDQKEHDHFRAELTQVSSERWAESFNNQPEWITRNVLQMDFS